MEQTLKQCSKCGEEKSLSEFYFRKDANNYRADCKECNKQTSKNYDNNHKEHVTKRKADYQKNHPEINAKAHKKYFESHKKQIQDYQKEWAIKNKEHVRQQSKEWYLKNKDRLAIHRKKYRYENIEEYNQREAKYRKNNRRLIQDRCNKRRKTDIKFRIRTGLASRLTVAVRDNQKSGHTLELLGCSIPKLKKHLESQFQEGMTWDNYGLKGWHIDHIKPCASFDLSKPEEQHKCFHYSNLQPLWWLDNIKKGSKPI